MKQVDSILAPHSEEAEMAVLGCLLTPGEHIAPVMRFLEPRHFFIVKNGWIYESMRNIADPTDLLALSEDLARRGLLDEAGGQSYIGQLMTSVPYAGNAEQYARIVEDYAIRRSHIDAAQSILRMAYDTKRPLDDIMRDSRLALSNTLHPQMANELRSSHDVFAELMDAIEERHENPALAAGTPTGFADIDRLLGGGYHKSELILIASRPGMGKTSLLDCIAANITGLNRAVKLDRQYTVAIFSMEMSAEALAKRLLAIDTGIDSQRIQGSQFKDDEWNTLTSSCLRHSDATLFINEEDQSVESMVDSAERLMATRPVDLIMADYLGLFKERGDAYEHATRIARDLKNAAKHLKVPIVAAAQLSRSCEGRDDKRPKLSDLRDSGELEQAADVVQFIYRDEYYDASTDLKNIAEIITAKNRNGPTGTAKLFFNKALTKFAPLNFERLHL